MKTPTRSMCSLRSRTINRFKQSPKKPSAKTSPKSSGKVTPLAKGSKQSSGRSSPKLTFTPLKALPHSKPYSPTRYINKASGTMMIMKKP